MGEWHREVDRRLAEAGVPPARRIEIVAEVETFLLDRFEEFRQLGHSEPEARTLALEQLTVDDFVREVSVEERRRRAEPPPPGSPGRTAMASIWQDLGFAVRSIRRTPAVSALVLATLALGIGANAAIFSVADIVMLRPYSYPDMERIVMLMERTRAGQPMSVAWPTFRDWHAQNGSFEHLGIYRSAVVNLTGGDAPAERLNAAVASSGLFGALGIPAALGRVFTPADDQPGAPARVVISERLWRSRFQADPAVVGRPILLDNVPHTVVGVMPAGMRFPSRLTDAWLPLGPVAPTLPTSRGAHPGLIGVGKLKPGVTFERAVADMDTIARRLEAQYPDTNRDVAVDMNLYYEQIVGGLRPTLLVLLGAVGFVLLIACANLANLMLARAERRHRELAVRRALGADRRRLVQQLLAESLVLALAGGVLGVGLAYGLVEAFVASRPVTIPRIDLLAVDRRVVLFSVVISVLTGVVFGLVPALRASNPDIRSVLQGAGRGSILGVSRRLRSALIVAEVALAVVLLTGAGLMIRSFSRLTSLEAGFDPHGVVTLRLTLPHAKYPEIGRWRAFHEALVERVGALPAVEAVAVNSAVPLEGGGAESALRIEGRAEPPPEAPAPFALFQSGTPEYFRAMRIPLLRGRFFDARDTPASTPVVIVDETLVRTHFPDEDPLGKRVSFEMRGSQDAPVRVWREIVGVVGHVRHYGLATGPRHVQVYAPFAQLPVWFERRRPAMALIARTALPAESLSGSIRREVAALDPDVPIYNVQTLDQYLSQHTEGPRLNVLILGGLGTLALVLAAVGIYGVVSYSVAQRTQEIGVRMALGASHRGVLGLVAGQAFGVVVVGIAAGVGGSLALSSFVRSLLFGVSERDPATLATTATLLAVTGALAAIIPARRAAALDPVAAMREQ